MYDMNNLTEEPVTQEVDIFGWTYIFIIDSYNTLPLSFSHDDDVVGVQVATHEQSAGTLRRIRRVEG